MGAIRDDAFGGSGPREAPVPRRVAGVLLLIAAPLLFPLYTANVRIGTAPETLSATLTAHSVAREGNLDLREYFADAPIKPRRRYAFQEHDGRLLSIEPLASSLTFVPFLAAHRSADPSVRLRFRAIGHRAAAQAAIVAVVLLGWWLLSLTSIPRALAATATIALATNHATTVASGLWSHTGAILWSTAGLFLWSSAPKRPGLYPLAGAFLAVATGCRPIFAPALALVCLDAFSRRETRRHAVWTAAVAGALGAAVLVANEVLFGSPLGGRGDVVDNVTQSHRVASYFAFSPAHWAGLLASPSRGLFVYSPVLLFALPGLVWSLGRDRPTTLRAISSAGVLCFAMYGVIATWWGGWVFGPRYMTDLLPFFALWLALTPIPGRSRPVWVGALAIAAGWSVGVQQLGIARYPCGWNRAPTNIDHDHARLWDWSDTQLRRCWNAGSGARPGSARPKRGPR